MANSGPNTNSSQFCVMLGDRSYLDGNYTVFGEVVQGLGVVMSIVKGDVIKTVRILRVGSEAQAFHPTTESFQAMVRAAQQRAIEQAERKRLAGTGMDLSKLPQRFRACRQGSDATTGCRPGVA